LTEIHFPEPDQDCDVSCFNTFPLFLDELDFPEAYSPMNQPVAFAFQPGNRTALIGGNLLETTKLTCKLLNALFV